MDIKVHLYCIISSISSSSYTDQVLGMYMGKKTESAMTISYIITYVI